MSQDPMEPPEQRRPSASPPRDPVVDALQERLGVPVVRDELALAAVTHKSFVNEHRGEGLQDNERLEFLGDAVIDLAVSQRLMERFPCAREGELSKSEAVDALDAAKRAYDRGNGAWPTSCIRAASRTRRRSWLRRSGSSRPSECIARAS